MIVKSSRLGHGIGSPSKPNPVKQYQFKVRQNSKNESTTAKGNPSKTPLVNVVSTAISKLNVTTLTTAKNLTAQNISVTLKPPLNSTAKNIPRMSGSLGSRHSEDGLSSLENDPESTMVTIEETVKIVNATTIAPTTTPQKMTTPEEPDIPTAPPKIPTTEEYEYEEPPPPEECPGCISDWRIIPLGG